MRIDRTRSRLSFRKRRRVQCLPLTLGVGLLIGLFVLSWHWLGERLLLRQTASSSLSTDLQSAARAFDTGDLDSAIEQAKALWHADSNRDNAAVLALLARALVYRSYVDYDRAGDRQTALILTTEAFTRMPTTTDIIAAHAFVLQANGNTTEAARLVTRALNQDDRHALARATRSLSYGGSGLHQQAMREAQAAALELDDLDAYRALALSLSDLGRPLDAIAAVDRAIAQNDKLLALFFEKAIYAIQAGQHDTATAAYFHVLAFDPDNVKARLRMCELSSLLRETDTALTYCQQVTDRAPTWADGWYRLGREYYLQGEFGQAQDALSRCANLQNLQDAPAAERIPACWLLQGEIAEVLGDCDALMRAYEDYQRVAARYNLRQTWTYPPEGPPICAPPASASATPASATP